MNQPEPVPYSFSNMIHDINEGNTKIPQFQRDFVWSKEKSAKLLDSILKGFPIGTFILWKTKEQLRIVRNVGNLILPDTPDGDYVYYVIDGQQRLTSLYAAIQGAIVIRDNEKEDDYSELYIDLTQNNEEDIVIWDISNKNKQDIIKIKDLIYGGLTFLTSYDKKHHDKLEEYKKRFESYQFSSIIVKEAPIDVATEIFTRINVTGRPLSVFEIMVAKTFDSKKNFDLAEEYRTVIDRLKDIDYETISDATFLQTMAMILKKECTKKVILKLDKESFINTWPSVVDSIEHAIDYLRDYYRIPVSKLLPYNAIVVLFAYFFYQNNNQRPTGEVAKYLRDFFWRISLTGRYSSSLESRLGQDIKKIDEISQGKLPTYEFGVDVSPKFIENNGWFGTGRSYIKAILCLLAYQRPKSFENDTDVRISNDWLKQANSKNYHHFFPKAYMDKNKKEIEFAQVNHIANITIVDSFLNKSRIKYQAPSRYMREFQKNNPNIEAAMKTHLININTFGVWEDEFETFFRKRTKSISKALSKRIIPQDVDIQGQSVNLYDYDETEMIEGE